MAKNFTATRRYSKAGMPVVLEGIVTLDGSGDPTSSTAIKGMTITHPGTGDYELLLDDKYQSLLSCSCIVLKSSISDTVPQFGATAVSTTRVVDLLFFSSAAQAAANPVSCSLSIKLVLEASSAPA